MSSKLTVFRIADLTMSLGCAGGRTAGMRNLAVGGITAGALKPMLGFVMLQNGEIVGSKLTVFRIADLTMSLGCAGGRTAGMRNLAVGGITAGALKPMLGFVMLQNGEIVGSKLTVFRIADLTMSLGCAGGRTAGMRNLAVGGITAGALKPMLGFVMLQNGEIVGSKLTVFRIADLTMSLGCAGGRTAGMRNLAVGGIAAGALKPMLGFVMLQNGEIVGSKLTVFRIADLTMSLGCAGGRTAGMRNLAVGGITAGALKPMLGFVMLQNGEIVGSKLTVFRIADLTMSLGCAGGRTAGMRNLAVGGITAGALKPMLGFVMLQNGEIVGSKLTVFRIADLTMSLGCAGGRTAGMRNLAVGGIAAGALKPMLGFVMLQNGEIVGSKLTVFRIADLTMSLGCAGGRTAGMRNLAVGGITAGALKPMLGFVMLQNGEIVGSKLTVFRIADLTMSLGCAGGRTAGMRNLAVGGITAGALKPMLGFVMLQNGEIVGSKLTVFRIADLTMSLGCAGGRTAGMRNLAVGGITAGALKPMLGFVMLQNGEIVGSKLTVFRIADLTMSLGCAGGRTAGMRNLAVGGIAAGALKPMLGFVMLQNGEIVGSKLTVFRIADLTMSLGCAGGRTAGMRNLAVGGITAGALKPMLGFVMLQNGEIVG